MKEFDYTIRDPLGIHARPAGLLAKEAKAFSAVCTITKGDQTKKLTQLMMLMARGTPSPFGRRGRMKIGPSRC